MQAHYLLQAMVEFGKGTKSEGGGGRRHQFHR